ncbi:MAG: MBL fold metallo-hydrolase [Geminicoccaceae bacterium]|nr:MBL fold metallo-hydrolase [Geminicoccaceae bacterium]
MARVTVLSGLAVKGPAAILVETERSRLLLDLGRGPEPGAEVPLAPVGRVDAVLVTHGHADHAGALDRLVEIGDPPVWATAELRALCPLPPGGTLPLRGTAEVAGVRVTTGRAGHAPGGIWLHLGTGGGILYTGDLFDRSPIWAFDPPPAADTLLVDASYDLDPTPLETRRAAVLALLDRPRLLFPAPADGRGLELALFLFERTGRAPVLCPRTRAALARVRARARASLRAGAERRLAALAAAAPAWSEEPQGAVVAEGAKLDRGPAATLARFWADRADARIVLTGHVPRGCPAHDLLTAGRALACRWPVHPDRATIEALLARVRPRRLVPLFRPAPDLATWRTAAPGTDILFDPVLAPTDA